MKYLKRFNESINDLKDKVEDVFIFTLCNNTNLNIEEFQDDYNGPWETFMDFIDNEPENKVAYYTISDYTFLPGDYNMRTISLELYFNVDLESTEWHNTLLSGIEEFSIKMRKFNLDVSSPRKRSVKGNEEVRLLIIDIMDGKKTNEDNNKFIIVNRPLPELKMSKEEELEKINDLFMPYVDKWGMKEMTDYHPPTVDDLDYFLSKGKNFIGYNIKVFRNSIDIEIFHDGINKDLNKDIKEFSLRLKKINYDLGNYEEDVEICNNEFDQNNPFFIWMTYFEIELH